MRLSILTATATVLATIALPAAAQDPTERFAVGAQVGTTGIGVEGAVKLNDYVRLRATGDVLQYDDLEFDSDAVAYEAEFNLNQGGLFADVHPFRNAFLLSAGAYFGERQADLRATPTQNVQIGNTVFTPTQAGEITGEAELGDVAPFLGLGYNDTFTSERRFGFRAMVGAAFGEDPSVSLRRTGGAQLTPAVQAQLDAELRNEEREIEDDSDGYSIYPVVQLGLSYRF